jgi:hypothetical protein
VPTIRIRHFLPLLFCLALGWQPVSSQAQARFQIFKTTTNVFEYGLVTNYLIRTATSQAAFAQPSGASVEFDGPASTIKITPANHLHSITLQFTTNSPALLAAAHQAELRQQIEKRYVGSRISSGPPCYSGIAPGPSFNIERDTFFKTSLTTQLAFVALPEETLEVSLTAATTNFTSQRYVFASFLRSLHVTPR